MIKKSWYSNILNAENVNLLADKESYKFSKLEKEVKILLVR